MAEKESYMLISAPDACDIVELDSKEALIEELRRRKQMEQEAPLNQRVVIVNGKRVYLSKGEYKYAMFPDGSKLPLFLSPEDLEPDESGYLVPPLHTEDVERELVEEELFDYDENPLLDEHGTEIHNDDEFEDR